MTKKDLLIVITVAMIIMLITGTAIIFALDYLGVFDQELNANKSDPPFTASEEVPKIVREIKNLPTEPDILEDYVLLTVDHADLVSRIMEEIQLASSGHNAAAVIDYSELLIDTADVFIKMYDNGELPHELEAATNNYYQGMIHFQDAARLIISGFRDGNREDISRASELLQRGANEIQRSVTKVEQLDI